MSLSFGTQTILAQSAATINSIEFLGIDQWTVLGFSSWRGINQLLTTQLQYSGYSFPPVTSTIQEKYSFTRVGLYLGNSPASNSFTGFIWSLAVYSSIEDVSVIFVQTCEVSVQTDCLWPCNFDQYLQGAVCTPCNAACSNSVCRRGSDCSMCISSFCASCQNYLTCSSCPVNAELNYLSICECKDGYYLDSSSQICTACNAFCSRCTGPTLNDCICSDNSYLEGYQCICNFGYALNNTLCLSCDYRCLTCSALNYYSCLSCSSYLVESVCLPGCPVGYNALQNECALENIGGPALRFVFDTPQTRFTDKIQGIVAVSGSQDKNYPYLDSSDPVPAYQRGIYFTGNGSFITLPCPDKDTMLLGIRFFIAIWINPHSVNGTIGYYYDHNYLTLLSISLSDLHVKTSVQVDLQYFDYSSLDQFFLQEWNHMLLALDYAESSSLGIFINTYQTQRLYLSKGPFTDNLNSTMIIGADGSLLNFFNGFIYSLEIYLQMPQISNLAIENECDSCLVCPSSGICIPNCNIYTFYNETILLCMECRVDCANGCRTQDNCTLCVDHNCVSCSSFNTNSCTECANNYQVENNACSICNSSTFYDPLQKICENCIYPCEKCTSAIICTVCQENSHLDSNSACICDLGYALNNSICSRTSFYALLTISSTNIAGIYFTEDLQQDLSPNSINALLNEVNQQFTIQKQDNSSYSVSVSFTSNIIQGDKLLINFTAPVISVSNSILATQVLKISLFPDSSNEEAQSISQAKILAQTAIRVGVAIVLGSSFINLDPLSFLTS